MMIRNMSNEIVLTPVAGPDYPQIKEIYREAFPDDEKAPFWFLKWRYKQKRADFWAVKDSDVIVGLAYVICHGDLAYLFYLATDKSSRGKGYGTKTMNALKSIYSGRRLFLALETLDESAHNYEQRLKRHAFYSHCGLIDFPYFIKEYSVVYSIMGIGEPVKPEEYEAMIDSWLGPVIKHFIEMRFVNGKDND